MRCARIDIFASVFGVDSASDLQSSGVCREGCFRRFVVSLSEHDYMPALDSIFFVELGEPGWGTIGLEIRLESFSAVREGTSDNLLYAAVVQVYAGAELGH